MLASKKLLLVVVNPFATPLDHEGRPCTIAQYDPEHVAGYTLIRMERKTKPLPDAGGTKRATPRVDTTWSYSLEPKKIEDTLFHRELLKTGVLLAADAATSKAAGFKVHAPWEDLLFAARDKAVRAWIAQHDEPPPVESWDIKGMPARAEKAEKGSVQ